VHDSDWHLQRWALVPLVVLCQLYSRHVTTASQAELFSDKVRASRNSELC
jgi:hypothetical protein